MLALISKKAGKVVTFEDTNDLVAFKDAVRMLNSVNSFKNKIPGDWEDYRGGLELERPTGNPKKAAQFGLKINDETAKDEPDLEQLYKITAGFINNAAYDVKRKQRTQEGIASGFQATQAGGALGPDALEKGVKNVFKGKTKKPSSKKSNDTAQKKPVTRNSSTNIRNYKDIPDMVAFKDRSGTLYTFDKDKDNWISSDGKNTMDPKKGAAAYNQAKEKSKLESRNKTMDKQIKEGLADLAKQVEHDHEVQMARADLYKLAKYAIKLHEMLKNVSETEGIKGWQQSKITKASDYISSVYHNLDYEMKFGSSGELGEGKSPHKKGSKAYKKHMAAKHANMSESNDPYKKRLVNRLQEASSLLKK